MSFKKVLTASALVIGAFGVTAAQAQSTGFYAGASVGKGYYDLNHQVDQALEKNAVTYSRDLSKVDVKLFGGYDFNQNLAVEGGLVNRTKASISFFRFHC